MQLDTNMRLLGLIIVTSLAIAACNVDVTDSEREAEETATGPAGAEIEPTPTESPDSTAVTSVTVTPTSAPTPTAAPEPTSEPDPTPTPEPAVGAGTTDERSLYPIREGDLWGFIDRDGEVVIEPLWDRAWGFSEGFARIVTVDESFNISFGLIDVDGSGQIYDGVTYLDDLSEGIAAFAVGGEIQAAGYLPFGASWGYLDVEGNTVIEPQFDSAGPFVDGLAPVQINNESGYINPSGEFVIAPDTLQHSEAVHQFSEGRALVWSDQSAGYIDESGEFVIDHHYYRALDFSEGLAAVGIDIGKMGYIDRDGNVAIEPRFISAGSFSDGLAAASIETDQGPKYGYIDQNGEEVIGFSFDYAGEFVNGLAPVGIGEHFHYGVGGHPLEVFDGWGYIDTSGEFVWQQTEGREWD